MLDKRLVGKFDNVPGQLDLFEELESVENPVDPNIDETSVKETDN